MEMEMDDGYGECEDGESEDEELGEDEQEEE